MTETAAMSVPGRRQDPALSFEGDSKRVADDLVMTSPKRHRQHPTWPANTPAAQSSCCPGQNLLSRGGDDDRRSRRGGPVSRRWQSWRGTEPGQVAAPAQHLARLEAGPTPPPHWPSRCSRPQKHPKPGTTRIAKHARRAPASQRVPDIRFWNAAAPERRCDFQSFMSPILGHYLALNRPDDVPSRSRSGQQGLHGST